MRRRPILSGNVIIGLLLLVAVVPAIALAQSNPPSVECASDAWNGEYWKLQINDGTPGEIETNVAGAINFDVTAGVFSWTNAHTEDVFRWLFKNGNDPTVPWNGLWEPGEGDSAEMPGNLSHVTFCFTDPAPPTTTTSTTTTSEPPPSTTTTTVTTPPTTTTTTTTTTPSPSTTSTTTTTTPTPTTTTTEVTSTTTTTVSPPPTTTTTLPPPPTRIDAGSGGTAGNTTPWWGWVALALGIVLGAAGIREFRRI